MQKLKFRRSFNFRLVLAAAVALTCLAPARAATRTVTTLVSVDWTTASNTAGPADYVAASGTLAFAPGTTSKIIVVQVKGDTLAEPTETYRVNLTNPRFAVLGDSQGIGTIRDDDEAPPLDGIHAEEPSQ